MPIGERESGLGIIRFLQVLGKRGGCRRFLNNVLKYCMTPRKQYIYLHDHPSLSTTQNTNIQASITNEKRTSSKPMRFSPEDEQLVWQADCSKIQSLKYSFNVIIFLFNPNLNFSFNPILWFFIFNPILNFLFNPILYFLFNPIFNFSFNSILYFFCLIQSSIFFYSIQRKFCLNLFPVLFNLPGESARPKVD